MGRFAALTFALAGIALLGGCNLVFGLDLPAGGDDDVAIDGRSGDGAVDGHFDAPLAIVVPTPIDLALGQFDNHPGLDPVVASPDGNAAVVMSCTAEHTCSATFFSIGAPIAVTTTDVDGDQRDDIVAALAGGITSKGGGASVLLNLGDGDFSTGKTIPDDDLSGIVAAPLIGADAAPDLVFPHAHSLSSTFYLNDGAGGFTNATTLTTPGTPADLAPADLTGDAELELAVSDNIGVRFVLANGPAFFTFGTELAAINPSLLFVRLDSDEQVDLLLGLPTGELQIWLGDGNGVFHAAPVPSIQIADGGPLVLASGDVDGDGPRNDVVVASRGAGSVTLLHGSATGVLTAGTVLPLGGDPAALGLADLDGDGGDDLIVGQATAGQVLIFFAR